MTTTTREPLYRTATTVSGAAAVFTLLAILGLHVRPDLQSALLGVLPLLVPIGPFLVAHLGRKHVTPLVDPRDATGAPLVPVQPAPDTTTVDPDARGGAYDTPAPAADPTTTTLLPPTA